VPPRVFGASASCRPPLRRAGTLLRIVAARGSQLVPCPCPLRIAPPSPYTHPPPRRCRGTKPASLGEEEYEEEDRTWLPPVARRPSSVSSASSTGDAGDESSPRSLLDQITSHAENQLAEGSMYRRRSSGLERMNSNARTIPFPAADAVADVMADAVAVPPGGEVPSMQRQGGSEDELLDTPAPAPAQASAANLALSDLEPTPRTVP